MAQEHISPTRMNMLQRKAQARLAREGAELLRSKRDALMQEFMGLLKPLLKQREELAAISRRAFRSLLLAKAIDGEEVINSVSLATFRDTNVELEQQKIWGIGIPEVRSMESFVRSPEDRGYAITQTSARVDETAEAFERILDAVVRMAPTEVRLKRLGEEIRKTTRRVNALEEMIIPRYEEQIAYIRQTLEEREREDMFRLKRIKAKKATG
jgi:V/A-type H+-transporting ATPase subunit D